MPAAYDNYDYSAYWEERDYEHRSEVIVLKDLLEKIPRIQTILEIGAGFGRLAPYYLHRAKKIILTDPSAKHMQMARKSFKSKKFKFIQGKASTLDKKLRKGSADLVIVVRVLHHIDDIDTFFETISRLLSHKGYLILEFANKRHFKAVMEHFFRGDVTFLFDIFPKEVSTKKSKPLPFLNYHPDEITRKLNAHGFDVLEKRSVSNIRSTKLKAKLPMDFLLSIETFLQKTFSAINFGPSIFVLAQKRG